MSIRSVLASIGATISTALRAAGRAIRATARAGTAIATWTRRAVVDPVTGAVSWVASLVQPPVPVQAAEAAADEYLAEASVAAPAYAPPAAVEDFAERANPEAALVRSYAREMTMPGVYDAPTGRLSPELVAWLDWLNPAELARVAQAPLSTLAMHLSATWEPDLMSGLAPVRAAPALTQAQARSIIAGHEAEQRAGARRGGRFRDSLDELVAMAEEAGPTTPLAFR